MIETARLLLRPFEVDDVEAAFCWFGDPAVMRFIGGGPHKTIQQTARRIAEYREQQARLGFSKWIVVEKESGVAVGDSGLVVLNHVSPAPDLGFRFEQAAWGRGYATEVANAWIAAAFERFGQRALSAFVHVEHHRSRHVLEKVGLQFQARRLIGDMDAATYALTADEYAFFHRPTDST